MNEMFKGAKILIIGGTGTIGKHVLNMLLKAEPSIIRIFSRDEYKQFELQQTLGNLENVRYLIGDIRDYNRLLRAMEDVDYVFHAAAMKHVPACEYNPFEAVQTNIIGTQNVIQAALESKVKKVLFTSTDKAIAPTNVYGASKLTAERLISAAEIQKGNKTTVFFSVRFGNVMGSRGSVIPLFKQQIMSNRRVTVTDLNMLRFMMTSTQAISLMFKATSLARGGEVFVLKMPVIKMSVLTEVLIEEVTQKYNISDNIVIDNIGLRPGEKMYEELMTEDEARFALETSDMYIIPSSFTDKIHQYMDYEKLQDFSHIRDGYTTIDKETLRQWLRNEQLI